MKTISGKSLKIFAFKFVSLFFVMVETFAFKNWGSVDFNIVFNSDREGEPNGLFSCFSPILFSWVLVLPRVAFD